MKFNIEAKDKGVIDVGTYIRLKYPFRFDHAFTMKVQGSMVYYICVGIGIRDERIGNIGAIMGEMGANPANKVQSITVTLVEHTDLKKPADKPKSSKEDDISDWVVETELYKEEMEKLERHVCTKEEILYLIHELKTCDLNGKTIEIIDLAQLEKSVAQIEF